MRGMCAFIFNRSGVIPVYQIVIMSTPEISDGWLLLLYTLPAKKTAGRVSLWRKLKKLGAYALKTSGHVLPNEPAHFERFQWLVQQVRDQGGEATLARVTAIEETDEREPRAPFQ